MFSRSEPTLAAGEFHHVIIQVSCRKCSPGATPRESYGPGLAREVSLHQNYNTKVLHMEIILHRCHNTPLQTHYVDQAADP
jgi:hypothetical protein